MAKFSSQHYKAIAEVFRVWYETELRFASTATVHTVDHLVDKFGVMFQLDNTKFDTEKFDKASIPRS